MAHQRKSRRLDRLRGKPGENRPKGTEDFFNVFLYIQNPQKTEDGSFVNAINCLKQTALRQMILTKQRYGKEDNYIAWHGYQSFKPGEVTPERCHEIGIKLAQEMWGDRFQVIVTTHLHNHFCFNSVSFRDGKKYNYSKAEQQRLRDISDRLCREYGLSVIEHGHKAPSRPVWLDEQSGKPTRYNVYRADVREAVNGSRTVEMLEKYLRRKGYLTDFTGKHWKIHLPQYRHFTRLDTLDERWTPENIRSSLGAQASFGNKRPTVNFAPDLPEELRVYVPFQPTGRVYRLFLYWEYQIGILPKGTDYKPTSPFMQEELRKLDEIIAQVDYLAENHIETLDDLLSARETILRELDTLTDQRTKLQNKIRRAPSAEKERLWGKKQAITAQISVCRKKLKLNTGVEERSAKIQDTMYMVYTNEERLDWLREYQYSLPISFEREVGGTVYAVNAHFSSDTAETVEKKVIRILNRNITH